MSAIIRSTDISVHTKAAILAATVCCGAVVASCGGQTGHSANGSEAQLVFLTRNGCANTAIMRENLDTALRSLDLPVSYDVINLDALSESDPRSGYPTPTVLFANRDLFGMPPPPAPHPPAT